MISCVHAQLLIRVWLFGNPGTITCQAPLSPGFSRQEYWSEFLFLPPGDLPDPWIKPTSPALAGEFFTIKPCLTPKIRSVASKIRIRVLLSPWEFGDPEGYMQSTSWEMLGWKKHKLESRLPGEISITSDMQTPLLWQKWRGTKKPFVESARGEWKSWLKAQHSEN